MVSHLVSYPASFVSLLHDSLLTSLPPVSVASLLLRALYNPVYIGGSTERLAGLRYVLAVYSALVLS
jgi:hypothetical protein